MDRRLMAFEQLESVWPVHGSVLVQNDEVWITAGRSNFLDGGLRLIRLDVGSGELISETIIDEKNPATGENLQEKLQVLNMPVGLTDILSSDGQRVYMRSQQFDLDGNRQAIGPHSGQPAEQGSVQKGDTAHLFAPMGYLDDTWFHRSYWVYGRSFAGGHGGYYQAGKYAPSGRILVSDDDKVYGFGRKPQYLKWTTTMEHQLFASNKTGPKEAIESLDSEAAKGRRRSGQTNMVRFAKSKAIDPTNTALSLEAWANPSNTNGVIAAHGGPAIGYALWLKGGRPQFTVRTSSEQETTVEGKKRITGAWTHLVGVLTDDKKVNLYRDGQLVASGTVPSLIPSDPAQAFEVGADDGGAVGGYNAPNGFMGAIDEVRIYRGALTEAEVADRFELPEAKTLAEVVLASSFDDGKAVDSSGHSNDGRVDGAQKLAEGRVGAALRFRGTAGNNRAAGSFVEHKWDQDVPLLVRAMLKAKDKLFIAGPPDLIDEESTFQQLVSGDVNVTQQLAEQDAALDGAQGAILQIISATGGAKLGEIKLPALPTWDGMAAANGRLYLTTTDGRVLCYGEE
jgi:hypothetical protein